MPNFSPPSASPPPGPNAGQILLLQQAQQLASLTDQCKTLTTMLAAAAAAGRGPKRPKTPEQKRLLGLTLREFCRQSYLPDRHHAPKGPTAELAEATLDKLRAALGRDVLVAETDHGMLRRLQAWLAARVAGGMSPATANLHLRQLRAIWNHAARWQWTDAGKRWRTIKPPPPMPFFPEAELEVNAWTPEELSLIEARARKLTGEVGGLPADVFWAAWALVIQKIGCRITAMMMARRDDYDRDARAILLRRENQKQKRDQRIALPPSACAAVERLLAAYDGERIFGCWPFDPPNKTTGRRHWRVLTQHFERLLVEPAGLTLQKGVKTRQFRRTAATIVDEQGGNAQELLGHASGKTTERYKDRKRRPICRQSLLIPDADRQQRLF